MIRAIRIVGTAITLAFLFRLSREISESYGNEDVAGYSVAVGVVGFLFLVRALVSEFATKEVHVVQRDILWGLTAGAFVTLLTRLAE
jgi:hypothetical protein